MPSWMVQRTELLGREKGREERKSMCDMIKQIRYDDDNG